MSGYNWYTTLEAVKAELGVTDTALDGRIKQCINQASRQIDTYCDRFFYVNNQTQYFTAPKPEFCVVSDLLAVTSLATDLALDRAYSTIWLPSYYELEEPNALLESPPEPYWRIVVVPRAHYYFPTSARCVQVAGKWGYYEVLESLTTLAADVTSSATTISVPRGAAQTGQTLLIDSEQMFVSRVATGSPNDTLTVNRGLATETGLNGTTRAAHSSGAAISAYTYPVIERACLLQALRLHKRVMAPLGILTMPESGHAEWVGQLDPDARNLLAPFQREYLTVS